jgi:lipoyl(octanoyl) transferase
VTDWRLIDSGPCPASFNMALDEAIAISVRKGSSPPTLRIYSWAAPSLTLGAFQKPDSINLAFCRDLSIPVVRRLTGGRAVLHDDELTYSLSALNDSGFSGRLMDVYMKIGSVFHVCFEKLGLDCSIKSGISKKTSNIRNPHCFESTSIGEISHAGHKLIGSAQKRWNDAFLQQGSIPFSVDLMTLSGIFSNDGAHEEQNRIFNGLRKFIPDIDAGTLKKILADSFEETFDVSLAYSLPSQEELRVAIRLASQKYPDLAWSQAETSDSRCGNRTERVWLP